MEKSLPNRLGELAGLFLKLGIIGFGGPVAHIAMIEDEVVKRRRWLTREHFLDLLGATNLIPGPNSTEMAIHVGYVYAGWLGLVVSGVSFILPAVLITGVLAWLYVNYGSLPQVAPLLYGIKPAVFAVVVNALWGLAKKAVKTRKLLVIAFAVVVLILLLKLNEVIALLIGGIVGMIWLRTGKGGDAPGEKANLLISALSTGAAFKSTAVMAATAYTPANFSLWQLGLFFLKVGSVLFGGGFVLIAFLQGELVQEYGWLTQQQLLDAIAIGQFTPGPILSTATFIGYIIAGIPGAVVSTLGIFIPSFLFTALLNPLVPLLRSSKWTSAFLDAVNVGAVALMFVVTLQLGIATFKLSQAPFIDFLAVAIAIGSTVLAIRYKINAAWLVLGGALIGWGAKILI